MASTAGKLRVDIELAFKSTTGEVPIQAVVAKVHRLLLTAGRVSAGPVDLLSLGLPPDACDSILALRICEPACGEDFEDYDVDDSDFADGAYSSHKDLTFSLAHADVQWKVYQCNEDEATQMTVASLSGSASGGEAGGDGQQEDSVAYSQLLLPSVELEGSWEALVLPSSVKTTLMSFAMSSLLFGQRGVDGNFVAANKVILLHGPPGEYC
jgi:hypothetical protein